MSLLAMRVLGCGLGVDDPLRLPQSTDLHVPGGVFSQCGSAFTGEAQIAAFAEAQTSLPHTIGSPSLIFHNALRTKEFAKYGIDLTRN